MEGIIEVAKTVGVTLAEIILAIYFCRQYIKQKLKKPDISSLIPKQNKLDLEIMEKMEYVKEILNADRIHIYEFHNGEHYSDYRSSCRFSCSYEVVRAGKYSVRSKCTGLPISVMPKFINQITTNGMFKCRDIETLKDDMPSTYAFKHEIGIKSFYDTAIRNTNGNIIGFVAIQWDEGTIPKIDEDEIKKLVWYIEEHIQEAICLSK